MKLLLRGPLVRLSRYLPSPPQNEENGFIKDRHLRVDGFIIRTQVTIRTDGFIVRAGFAKTCTLRVPTSFSVRIQTIRTENEVSFVRSRTTESDSRHPLQQAPKDSYVSRRISVNSWNSCSRTETLFRLCPP